LCKTGKGKKVKKGAQNMCASSRKNLDVASKKKYNEAKQGAYAAQGVFFWPCTPPP
jgi:hypothetical protein